MKSQNGRSILDWALRIVAASIMLQTLFFKFTGSEESIYIFSTLGMEPWGRLGIGSLELIASIMLLIPATVAYGALLGTGLMAGAIVSHLTKLGIIVLDDHGQLFIYASVVLIICTVLLIRHRSQVPLLSKIITRK